MGTSTTFANIVCSGALGAVGVMKTHMEFIQMIGGDNSMNYLDDETPRHRKKSQAKPP